MINTFIVLVGKVIFMSKNASGKVIIIITNYHYFVCLLMDTVYIDWVSFIVKKSLNVGFCMKNKRTKIITN